MRNVDKKQHKRFRDNRKNARGRKWRSIYFPNY